MSSPDGPAGDAVHLRQLRAFVTVAEAGSIGAAAELLGTAQPPLSRLILRLEQRLGLKLLDRHSRGVRLTAAGEALVAPAREVLESVRRFATAADEVATGQAGVLRVGTTEGAGALISAGLRLFADRLPRVQVRLHPAHTPTKLAMLRAGELDVAFVRNPEPGRGVEIVDVWREPLVAVVADDHPLAGRPEVGLAALAPYPLMVTAREVNAPVHDAVLAIFERAGVTPTPGPPVHTEADALAQIAATRRWTLLSPTAARTSLPVTTLPIADVRAEVWVSLAWRAHDGRHPVREFVAAVREAAGTLLAAG